MDFEYCRLCWKGMWTTISKTKNQRLVLCQIPPKPSPLGSPVPSLVSWAVPAGQVQATKARAATAKSLESWLANVSSIERLRSAPAFSTSSTLDPWRSWSSSCPNTRRSVKNGKIWATWKPLNCIQIKLSNYILESLPEKRILMDPSKYCSLGVHLICK